MTITHHKIEEGMHAATSITEVRNFSPVTDPTKDYWNCFEGDGFCFWDETEAGAMGPFDSLEQAKEQRDLYYKSL